MGAGGSACGAPTAGNQRHYRGARTVGVDATKEVLLETESVDWKGGRRQAGRGEGGKQERRGSRRRAIQSAQRPHRAADVKKARKCTHTSGPRTKRTGEQTQPGEGECEPTRPSQLLGRLSLPSSAPAHSLGPFFPASATFLGQPARSSSSSSSRSDTHDFDRLGGLEDLRRRGGSLVSSGTVGLAAREGRRDARASRRSC